MGYAYSPRTRGFYHSALGALPADAVAISDAEHAALMEGQRGGQQIVTGPGGRPTLIDAALTERVPALVTRLQARLYLLGQQAPEGSGHAHLWGWLEAWAADPARSDTERAYWQDAQTWRRDDPLVASVTQALGLTSDAVDQMFVAAAAI